MVCSTSFESFTRLFPLSTLSLCDRTRFLEAVRFPGFGPRKERGQCFLFRTELRRNGCVFPRSISLLLASRLIVFLMFSISPSIIHLLQAALHPHQNGPVKVRGSTKIKIIFLSHLHVSLHAFPFAKPGKRLTPLFSPSRRSRTRTWAGWCCSRSRRRRRCTRTLTSSASRRGWWGTSRRPPRSSP